MNGEFVTKSAMSITETARLVGLSRARFGQLVKAGTFPAPDREPTTGRPFYSEEKQRICLEVRRRNCGIDGKPVLFYARRRDVGTTKAKPRSPKAAAKSSQYDDLIDHLASVNVTITAAQVEAVVNELFPEGTDGIDPGEVFLAVLRRFQRSNPADKQGR